MILITTFTVILCLQTLQGVTSLQFLLQMDKSISIINTENKTKEIIARNISSLISWDYHYDKRYLYFIERKRDNLFVGDLIRMNLRDKTVVPLPFSTDNTGELEVAVDWVRDEIYVVTAKDTVMKADLDGQNRKEVLNINDVKPHFRSPLGHITPYTVAFSIEPYEEFMFLTYNITSQEDSDNKNAILKADLNGTVIEVHGTYIDDGFINTVIDTKSQWLYMVRDSEIHYLPYKMGDSARIGSLKLSKRNVGPPRLSDAFEQSFYVAYAVGNDIKVYEFETNLTNYGKEEFGKKRKLAQLKSTYSAEDICKISQPRTKCIEVGVLLYGMLRQRQLNDDVIIECKRQDCSHGCEILRDAGETCTCPEKYVLKEDRKTCEEIVCRVPFPTSHRVFTKYPCPKGQDCGLTPGTSVSHKDLVTVSCDPGYYSVQGVDDFSSGSTLSVCSQRVWFPRLPNCIKLCPPLTSLTVKFTCYQGPRLVSCDKPMLPGTVVEFSCKEYHDSNDKNHANGLICTCLGEWSRQIPYCTPNCGISNLNSYSVQPAILGETFSEMGNFPWHAGVYHKKNDSWLAVCGGTLVSPKVILTAAHCVTIPCLSCKSSPMSPKDVMVALGKIYQSWERTEKSQVKKAVKEIRVHQDYVGNALNYGQDIALLVMDSAVEVNNFVMPACVDFSRFYVKQFAENRNLQGYVAGWGNTKECFSFGSLCCSASETLKYARTTIIFFNECFVLSQSLSDRRMMTHSRLTNDKFCAGDGHESVVQRGDSGGGLTFVFDGLHYLFGVVSLKLKLEIGERTAYSFGAFTNVQNYLDWLKIQFYEI